MKSRRHFIKDFLCYFFAGMGSRSFLTAKTARDPASSAPGTMAVISSEHPATLYPFVNDYAMRMTMKPLIDVGRGGPGPEVNLHELLDWMRKVDNLTRGVPKLVVLVGVQEGGHDEQYPSMLLPLNSKLKLPEFADARESLIWFMREVRKYHTVCTVHNNCMDAYKDSPLWEEYEKADLFSRHADGSLITTGVWGGRPAYHVSQAREWREGWMQKRFEALLNALPPIKESGVIYLDANVHFEASPWHGISSEDERQAFKAMCAWLREKHGMDVVGEFSNPEDYGFVPVGFTFKSHTLEEGMQAPAYLACGGYGGDRRLGRNTQIEGHCQDGHRYWKAPGDELTKEPTEKDPKEGFYFHTLPWFYLNRLLRIGVDQKGVVQFSDDVQTSAADDLATGRKKVIMTRRGKLMQDGFNVFIPARWRANREIMASSVSGISRVWEFPDEWRDVKEVDIYDLTDEGPVLAEAKRDISDGTIALALKARHPVSIVPAGTDIHGDATIEPVGSAHFLGEDRDTHGNWIGRYGSEGYDMAGLPSKLPAGVELNYIGAEDICWSRDSKDRNALQNPLQGGQRLAAARTCILHEIAEVFSDKPIEIALYCAGLDGKARQMLVEVVDPATMKVLVTCIVREVKEGVYTRFEVEGRIYLRLTRLLHENMGPVEPPLLSGIFFGKQDGK